MMNKPPLSHFGKYVLWVIGVFLLIGILVILIKTTQQSTIHAYHPPVIDTPYMKPGKTNVPDEGEPSIPPSPIPVSVSEEFTFFNRQAEVGTIIETSFSTLPSSYLVVNQWFAKFDDQKVIVYAGAQVNDPANGGKALPEPWPGILAIRVINNDGIYNLDKSGNFKTAENNGPLRIIEANSEEIDLVTRDGHRYIFDLNSRTFTSLNSEPPYIRQLDAGAIWETGNAPVITDEYAFWNYWLLEKNNEQLYVFAGATNNDPSQGVLIKYSIKLNEDKRRGVIYFTPINDGPTRIVDIVDGKLIAVTLHGMEYAFDVENEQLFEFDHNKTEFSPINPIYQAQPIEFKESEMDTLVSPTISPTVTQTITPLPSATPQPTVPYP